MHRQTIRQPVTATGFGVFTGRDITLTLRPAGGGGIRFLRSDVGVELPADVAHLADAPNCTALSDGQHSLLLTEHLLCACHGLGVTDLQVQVEGEELPCFDGSVAPWVELLLRADLQPLEAPVEPLTVTQPCWIAKEGKVLGVLPYDGLRVSYCLEHSHPLIGTDFAEYCAGEHDFVADFAPARTFITEEEVRPLLESGRLKTQSVEYALVIFADRYSAPLRLPHEFPKHKILDLLGDLYLLGRPVRGHFLAYRTGHAENRALIRRLAEQGDG